MSEALARVIAEQQAVIDRLKLSIEQNITYTQKNFRQREELKDAVFCSMNSPGNDMYKSALRDTLRNQGWCLQCEQMPCECDD